MTDTTQTDAPPVLPVPLTVVETGKITELEAQVAALQAELNKPGPAAIAGAWLAKWHPVIVGAAVAIVPPLLNYLGTVNWQTIGVSPSAAVFIGALIMVLRTTTLKVNT